MKGQLFSSYKPSSILGSSFEQPKRKNGLRKPIKSKIRKQLTVQRKKCKWCRKHPIYEIHHIDGNRSNNTLRNLIGLCANCHKRATYGEITKEQLRKRLGFKQVKKRTKKRMQKKIAKYQSPFETVQNSIRKESERQSKIFQSYGFR
jgi:hypothetical protein